MPLIAWSRRPESGAFVARVAAAAQGNGDTEGERETTVDGSQKQPAGQYSTESGLFDPRVAAWMSDTGTTDKALEFEALCVSWLKDNAAPTGESCGLFVRIAAENDLYVVCGRNSGCVTVFLICFLF